MNFRKRNTLTDKGVIEVPLSQTETAKSILSPRSGARTRNESSTKIWFLTIFLFSVATFYVGLFTGWSDVGAARHREESSCRSTNSVNTKSKSLDEETDNQASKIVQLEETIRNLEQRSQDTKIAQLEETIRNLEQQLKLSEHKKETDSLENTENQASKIVQLEEKIRNLEQRNQATKFEQMEETIRNLEQQLKLSQHKKETDPLENKTLPSRSPFDANIFDKAKTGKFASGIEFVDRNDFAASFDTGVTLDKSTTGNNQVAILYSDAKAFPAKSSYDAGRSLSVEEATSNCNNLHLVLTHTEGRTKQCIAIMGQLESFHVYKFMRVDGEKGKIDPDLPLQYTSRGHQQNGRVSARIPGIEQTKQHWDNLVLYLKSLETAQEELKPILENVSSHNNYNAVIVLVCNFGQSDLLLNCKYRSPFLVWFHSVSKDMILYYFRFISHTIIQCMVCFPTRTTLSMQISSWLIDIST